MSPTAPADPLAGLRGWHLPEPVSWWPPAPGWWVLSGLTILLAAATTWWVLRFYRSRAAARTAKGELRRLRELFRSDGDAAAFARGLSRLLRRYAIARFPRRQVAGLAGGDWLAFLDEHGGGGRFRGGPGRVLAEAPYRPVGQIAADDLTDLVEDWIARNAGRRR
jgi:hypothetical protein